MEIRTKNYGLAYIHLSAYKITFAYELHERFSSLGLNRSVQKYSLWLILPHFKTRKMCQHDILDDNVLIDTSLIGRWSGMRFAV